MSSKNKAVKLRPEVNLAALNARGQGFLPGLLGVEITACEEGLLRSRMRVEPHHMAPNGYLHAASVIALADTTAGFGTIAHLPQGAQSFTTIELKTNFLSSTREGIVVCVASLEHGGRNTQIWDAVVSALEADGSERRMAMFRCTQMILWPRA
ncbi:MAG: PaaI family thioesterase [Rhodocyclaceae bacterium]|nr:PaaI family thioesterase [Rhodocyclaceae bacterium]